jgi:hypothetical protein
MIQRLESAVRIELVRHDSGLSLDLSFEPAAIRDCSLGLVLLKERLIEVFVIAELTGRSALELRRSGQAGGRARASLGGSTSRLALSDSELDHLVHFFLKYLRDGVAEVDHVDVQALSGDDECYVTFNVNESAPPVSPSEARRRLGLK